jgi:hypothetical protein
MFWFYNVLKVDWLGKYQVSDKDCGVNFKELRSRRLLDYGNAEL